MPLNRNLVGWIDEVDGGRAWGRCHYECRGEMFEFDIALTDILEDQRSYIEPGIYVSFPNGHLLVDKALWSRDEIEKAKAKAEKLLNALGWGQRMQEEMR